MRIIVGIDEVGRGAIAGPVVVGAIAATNVSFTPEISLLFAGKIRDSKQSSRLQRERVATFVQEQYSWGIGSASAQIIDSQGIQAALKLAAGEALVMIAQKIGHDFTVEADAGLFHPFEDRYPTTRSIKADERLLPVLLASHVAKVYRDTYMRERAESFPVYDWQTNVGYGTAKHFAALCEYGPSAEHRQSFLKRL